MSEETVSRPVRRRVRAWLVPFLLVLSSVVAVAPNQAGASATIYVAPWGDDRAAGTVESPLRTVRHAVWRANSGDAIVLREGIYRENVQILGKAVALASAPGERAVFDGTEQLTGWQISDEDWFVDDWTRQFPREAGALVAPDNIEAGYPDQVFLDGRPLRQVLLRSLVEPGTFFHDTARDRIYIGDDPNGRRIDASLLPWALYFNDAHGSSLTDITVRRFATPSDKLAAVRVHSNDVVVDGVTIELNSAAGLSAIGSNIVIRNGRFSDNGHLGVHVHASETVVVLDSAIVGNNKSGFDPRHSAGGLKVTASTGITVRDNEVSRNGGPGIWTDLATRYITISHNHVEANGRSGIEVELSHFVNVVNNIVSDSGESGIWILESQDVQVFHNASFRNVREIYVLEGPRQQVRNVTVMNNVVGNGLTGRQLVVVDDWTNQRTAAQIGVKADANAYWKSADTASPPRGSWMDWTLDRFADRGVLRSEPETTVTDGFGWSRFATETPGAGSFWRRITAGQDREPETVRLGVAVFGSLAEELGVNPGERLPIGPLVSPLDG